MLKPGGRMAFVVPAELLQVTYAAQLRAFLADRFDRIEIIACNHLFFENAEQEVVLLLADGYRGTPSKKASVIDLVETDNVMGLLLRVPMGAEASRKELNHGTEKWIKYFLTAKEITFMRALRKANAAVPLSHHATVDVGVVTGKNDFFVVSAGEIERHDLGRFVVPLAARSSHLRGAVFTAGEWRQLAEKGERVSLLYVNGHDEATFTAGLRAYIRKGERDGVHRGYKCSIRKPWYTVPSMWVPKLFFFRQIYDFPRAAVNLAGATATDTVHRMECTCDPAQLASNIYTHLTAASAEIEGRSYGGGVLELEPTEAEHLLVPREFHGALPVAEVDTMVRAGRIADVLEENDRVVLEDGLGLTAAECGMLKKIWVKMRDRRRHRGRGRGRAGNS